MIIERNGSVAKKSKIYLTFSNISTLFWTSVNFLFVFATISTNCTMIFSCCSIFLCRNEKCFSFINRPPLFHWCNTFYIKFLVSEQLTDFHYSYQSTCYLRLNFNYLYKIVEKREFF